MATFNPNRAYLGQSILAKGQVDRGLRTRLRK